MTVAEQEKVTTLEQGNIYFFYRPRVQEEEPESLEDIQRLYMILSPENQERFRLAVIGRKKLPAAGATGERYWGFIDLVRKSPDSIRDRLSSDKYTARTRGERHVPAARPVGEGVYQLLSHEDHTHLVYILELPREPGEAQEDLQIQPEGSYIISIKNPEAPSPGGVGLQPSQKADFPKYLQDRFKGRRFSEVNPPELLDREGAEFVMIAAAADFRDELGIALHGEDESASSADLFRELKLDRKKHPTGPLFQGKWE
jgi:hypothetical protein